ncbi:MAG: ATP-binding cassette domain-containing protein [Acidobacteriota bacterium]|nr:MAG: ATP-binding cassette domain-containing protein [Acidobacteriota bacterium]
MNVLQVRGLLKSFESGPAVRNVSFNLYAGEILGLIGANGAGKTTTMKIILGLLTADRGEVIFGGSESRRPDWRTEAGWVPQSLAFYPELTVWENLSFFGRVLGVPEERREGKIREMIEIMGLGDVRDRTAATLSGGFQRRLNLALGLIHEPGVLILDEPTVGIDSDSRRMILDHLVRLSSEGRTILLASHYAEEIWPICHRIACMTAGELVYCEPVEKLHLGLPSEIRVLVTEISRTSLERIISALPEVSTSESPGGLELSIRWKEGDSRDLWLKTLSDTLRSLRHTEAKILAFNAFDQGLNGWMRTGVPSRQVEQASPLEPQSGQSVRLLRLRAKWGVALVLAILALGLFLISRGLQWEADVQVRGLSSVELRNSAPSPDGRYLAFLRESQLWLQESTSDRSYSVPDTFEASGPLFWSPDGMQLAYVKKRGLWRTEVLSETSFLICELPDPAIDSANWGPTNVILLRTRKGQFYEVSVGEGIPREIGDPANTGRSNRSN